MIVLVDTSVWSIVLRKRTETEMDQLIKHRLSYLIDSDSIVMIGAIRQEILSGISSEVTFDNLKEALSVFNDFVISTNIYIKAAEYFNICRKNGIQGSHIDFLICAVSTHYKSPIFTLDKDFFHYQKYIPIEIFQYE